METTAIVLAAGEGTRMKSKHPKVAHKMLGRPLVRWAVEAAKQAGAQRVIAVIGNGASEVREILAGEHVECVLQQERLGTGHALRVALDQANVESGCVVVLYGDTPLVEPATINALSQKVIQEGYAAAVLTMEPQDPTGYGRILFDENGAVAAIIEHKDCTPEQQEELRECNSGIYAFDGRLLKAHVGEIANDNAQGEYYITDMVEILNRAGERVVTVHVDDDTELLGVNSRRQLAEATKIMQRRINGRLMDAGVTMLDPECVWVGPEVTVGRDTELLPGTFLWGATSIGEDCVVGPNTRLTNTQVGNGCTIDETVAQDVVIENQVECGPRAYLRPGTHMLDHSKAGTHVEIKKSTIGQGSKVPHLSYIGDTTMGEGVNVGAGSITCNYDGYSKHATTIGDHAFIGSNTMMVAPVAIGEGALTGAASCIVEDVPAGDLGIARTRQVNVEGYAAKRAAAHETH